MSLRATVFVLASFAVGCAPADAGPCDGMHSCEFALFRADCGGSGEPTFACDPSSGYCLWFATACVPDGYFATDCPTTDPCCHGGPGGSWPFADRFSGASNFTDMVEDIAAIASTPVTSFTPAPIVVTIDPSVSPAAPSRATCDGGVPFVFCRATGFVPADTGAGAVTLSLDGGGLNEEIAMLEILPLGADRLGARMFTRSDNDGGGPSCEGARTPRPPRQTTGTLTLSTADLTSPSALHGRAELVVDGVGMHVLF